MCRVCLLLSLSLAGSICYDLSLFVSVFVCVCNIQCLVVYVVTSMSVCLCLKWKMSCRVCRGVSCHVVACCVLSCRCTSLLVVSCHFVDCWFCSWVVLLCHVCRSNISIKRKCSVWLLTGLSHVTYVSVCLCICQTLNVTVCLCMHWVLLTMLFGILRC